MGPIFTSLAAFGLMVAYGIDEGSAGVYATLGGICLAVVAWGIESEIEDRKRKQAQQLERKQAQQLAMKQMVEHGIRRPDLPSKEERGTGET